MIGLLTFQLTNNFGAHLHTIALYNKIKDLGYTCEIVDYRSPELINRETKSFRLVGLSPKKIVAFVLYSYKQKKKYKSLCLDLRKYTKVSPIYYPDTIKDANHRYNSFLIGSDVVWSLRITNYDYNYFLDFADDAKYKVAFSSSVGETDMYRDNQCLPVLLRRLNSISVREEEAVEWVKAISGKNANYVCDPTMLYTSKEWDKLIEPKKYESNYVLTYFGDPTGKMEREALEYANHHHLKLKSIRMGLPKRGVESVWPTSHAEFLGLIKYSKAFFTASYHGMLFGIYYHRELFCYNYGLKARMASLGSKLGIENHCGNDITNILNVIPIDYAKVDFLIDQFRSYSIKVLKQALDNHE